MKNLDLFVLRQKWHKLDSLTGVTFLMKLMRNKKLIDAEIEVLDSMVSESEEFKAFKKKYLKEREKFADRDETGKPVMEPLIDDPGQQTYKVTEKIDEWQEVEKELLEENKSQIELMDQKKKDYSEALMKKPVINLHMISSIELPENITKEQMDLIDFMIDFDS